MGRNHTCSRQRFVAVLLILAIGLSSYGCGDSATINPVVQLASLTVTPGTLQPAFTGGTTQYTVDLTSDVTSVRITAQPAVAGDTVTINGQATTSSDIPLGAAGTTTPVSIVVSESGTNSRTYIVLLVRSGLTGNNSLQNLTVSPGSLAPTFNPNTLTYSSDVADDVTSVTVSATKSDPNAVMSGSVHAGAGTATGQATISLGGPGTSNVVSVTVTAPNGSSKTYTITVERAAQASNNNLQSLAVSPGSLTPAFTPTRTRYTVNVESHVTSVTVTATLQDTNASMEINGQETSSGQAREIFLRDEGSSTNITIRVIPPNGNAMTYRVTVNRASNGDHGNNEGEGNSDGN